MVSLHSACALRFSPLNWLVPREADEFKETPGDSGGQETWCAAVHGSQRVRHHLATEQQQEVRIQEASGDRSGASYGDRLGHIIASELEHRCLLQHLSRVLWAGPTLREVVEDSLTAGTKPVSPKSLKQK